MIEKWIRGLARARWIVVILWVALVVGSVLTMPDLGQIVKETETKFLPADAESAQANAILERINPDDKEKSNAVIVLHRDGGLQEADRQWLKGKVEELQRDKGELNLASINSAFADPQLAEKFESKDKSTQLVAIGLPNNANDASTQEQVDQLRTRIATAPQGAEVYLTGGAPISKDYQQTSQDGLAKTEILTVVLVLAILLAVFRSPIAPLVPLITIAMSFVFARGFVALGTKFGLPVSAFTETFLVATLFGAGTDYCILLIHRFREELSKGHDRVDALVNTLKTVGKTVVFSASTVLIAFFLLGFAKFGLYQSAVGVSIGMAATLLAGLTLTPALMVILGPKLFWPFKIKPGEAHHDSKFWGRMAQLVAKRPVVVLIVTTACLAPLIFLYHGARSFNDIAEIDPNIGSVQGFHVVEKAFTSGEVLPTQITLTTSNSMRTPEGLAALEKASAALAQIQDVQEVRSAVRPLGQQLEDLTIPKELGKTTKGLGDLKDGVDKISSGLGDAKSQVQTGADGVVQMRSALDVISGKQREVAQGTQQIAQGTQQIASGLNTGVQQLQAGLPGIDQMSQGLNQLAGGSNQAKQGLEKISGGLGQAEQGMNQIGTGIGQSQAAVASMKTDLDALLQAHPELAQDPSVQALLAKQAGVSNGLSELGQSVPALAGGVGSAKSGADEIGKGMGDAAKAQTELAGAVGQLKSNLQTMTGQLAEGRDALHQISSGAGAATQGLHQLADGTGQMSAQVGGLQEGLGQLAQGLGDGQNGLGQVASGMSQIQDVQQGIADNGDKQVAGWYIPPAALTDDQLQKAFDTYLSADGKTTRFDVVFNINPYSKEAMAKIDEMRDTLNRVLQNSQALQNAQVKVTGTTAQYHELDGISNADFVRTGALILIGIYVVLALLLRSVLAPIYLLASLGFSYLVTMGIVEWLFVDVLGHEGLSWTVGFFGFILLVALGVDYSIFLMARFKEEYRPGETVAAMIKAMKSTGGVIISAAIIMGGTFGALAFSGVTSLMQIGTLVILGLGIYTVIVMGLIVPALAMLFGEANWWPLKRARVTKETKSTSVPSQLNL